MDRVVTSDRFATLTFERRVAAPVGTLWHAWLAPAARALWAAPNANVTVEFIETSTEVGGREVSLCKAKGYPDIRAEVRWLHLNPGHCAVNSEVITSTSGTDGVALVTADFVPDGEGSRIVLTVQLSAMAKGMEDGYRQGYDAGVANLGAVAERMMLLERVIKAPVSVVWGAWMNERTLPQWWGPDGFSCRTTRIRLGQGGEWLFDMIGPDGKVWPNHHRYGQVVPERRIDYALLAGENGPKHADAWAEFIAEGAFTRVRLGMVFETPEHYAGAKGFGAEALGLQTLGKLARFVGAD
jgi:uncharacterized protein YndB with AHSA1/START domain